MKTYARDEDVAIKCPSCRADVGVYCGMSANGPTVCERRARKVTDLEQVRKHGKCHLVLAPARWREQLVFTCDSPRHAGLHGPQHRFLKHLNRDSILVRPDKLYKKMVRKT